MWSLALLCLAVAEPSAPPLVQPPPEAPTVAEPTPLPADPPVALDWEHPWVVLKLGLGTPGNINLGVEVQATQNFALEVGAAAGLGANALEAGLRWRPDATCWGCRGANLFTLGFGAMGYALTRGNGQWDLMPALDVDAFYAHRFARHFGIIVGTRLGLGLYVSGYNGAAGLQPELLFYSGFTF